ncbi:MAG: hypothetical protein CL678_13665 [Bdellovibrionaceae bacterium]|nr:hypothetical protein [Pseudobdellovibrionaceae bacterium]|tara:strand:- start:4215 stop:6059 length:1845 start_codon:yes stop_codon:yes gene_type:complete
MALLALSKSLLFLAPLLVRPDLTLAYDGCHLERKENVVPQEIACQIINQNPSKYSKMSDFRHWMDKKTSSFVEEFSLIYNDMATGSSQKCSFKEHPDSPPTCCGNACVLTINSYYAPNHRLRSPKDFTHKVQRFQNTHSKHRILIDTEDLHGYGPSFYGTRHYVKPLKHYLPEEIKKDVISFGSISANGFRLRNQKINNDLYVLTYDYQSDRRLFDSGSFDYYFSHRHSINKIIYSAQEKLPGVNAQDLIKVLKGTAIYINGAPGKAPIPIVNVPLFLYVVKWLSPHWKKNQNDIKELLKDSSFFKKIRNTELEEKKEIPINESSSCDEIDQQYIALFHQFAMAPDREDFRNSFIQYIKKVKKLGLIWPRNNEIAYSSKSGIEKLNEMPWNWEKIKILLYSKNFDSVIRKEIRTRKTPKQLIKLYTALKEEKNDLKFFLSKKNHSNKMMHTWEQKEIRKKIKKLERLLKTIDNFTDTAHEQINENILTEDTLLDQINESQGLHFETIELSPQNFFNGTYKKEVLQQMKSAASADSRKAILYQIIYGLYEFRNYEFKGKKLAIPIVKNQIKAVIKEYTNQASEEEITAVIQEISQIEFKNTNDKNMILKILKRSI